MSICWRRRHLGEETKNIINKPPTRSFCNSEETRGGAHVAQSLAVGVVDLRHRAVGEEEVGDLLTASQAGSGA